MALKDELFVCLSDGWLHRLNWIGDVLQDLSFNIRNIPFIIDQISAKKSLLFFKKVFYLNIKILVEKNSHFSIFVVDLIYCPLIGGLCAVLSNGKAVLLVANNSQFQPETIYGVCALGLNDAVCCAANHKFRLIYFGCKK